MKSRIYILALSLVLISGCVNTNYGEVIKKEFVPGHMETTSSIETMDIGDTTICIPVSETHWVYDQYLVTFRNETGEFTVNDPELYNTLKVGQLWQKYPTEAE